MNKSLFELALEVKSRLIPLMQDPNAQLLAQHSLPEDQNEAVNIADSFNKQLQSSSPSQITAILGFMLSDFIDLYVTQELIDETPLLLKENLKMMLAATFIGALGSEYFDEYNDIPVTSEEDQTSLEMSKLVHINQHARA